MSSIEDLELAKEQLENIYRKNNKELSNQGCFQEVYNNGTGWKKDIFGHLYRFNGVFYEKVDIDGETERFYDCLPRIETINSSEINPGGINFKEGVLKVEYEGGSPMFNLVPHTPSVFYNYVSEYSYDPNADTTECDKMLEIFTEKDKEIVLKTLAASLDINRFAGIKPVLLAGIINSSYIEEIWGLQMIIEQVVGCPSLLNFHDFKINDRGQLFTLTQIFGAQAIFPRWSKLSIKQLLSSKSFSNVIDKRPILIGYKKQKKVPYTPNCVVFCGTSDEMPKDKNILEQINKKYAVIEISLVKEKFLYPGICNGSEESRVLASAFLNKIIKAFTELYKDGLRYPNGDFSAKIPLN